MEDGQMMNNQIENEPDRPNTGESGEDDVDGEGSSHEMVAIKKIML